MANTHKHYEAARRAHYHTSFTPEKRAETWCLGFDATVQELESLGVSAGAIAKYEELSLKHLSAKSRCLSSMITGPANFPVRRAEKANNLEHARSLEVMAYYDKIVKAAKLEAYYAKHPEARPVMAGDVDAVERLKDKLAKTIEAQEIMLAVNKIVRKVPTDREALLKLLKTDKMVDDILKPDFCGRIGFASYALTNNRAEIKRLEGRIKEIESRKATTPKDFTINGVRVVENTETMRLQLFFEGKPQAVMIATLKSHGFKWAPSVSAWQRQLTNNAVYAFNHWILPALKGAPSHA